MLELQASTAAVFPPHLPHSPVQLHSQQGERKHASFANPSTLQKCSAGKNHSGGTPSFRMVLKTVITQLYFCLFSSSAVAGWLWKKEIGGLHSEIFWNTVVLLAWNKMYKASHK